MSPPQPFQPMNVVIFDVCVTFLSHDLVSEPTRLCVCFSAVGRQLHVPGQSRGGRSHLPALRGKKPPSVHVWQSLCGGCCWIARHDCLSLPEWLSPPTRCLWFFFRPPHHAWHSQKGRQPVAQISLKLVSLWEEWQSNCGVWREKELAAVRKVKGRLLKVQNRF